jgi:hypothetical protein
VRSSERAAQNSPLPHEWGDRRGQEWSHFGESKYDPFLGIENAKRGMARKWMAIIDGIIASVMDHLLQRREKEFQRLQVRSVRARPSAHGWPHALLDYLPRHPRSTDAYAASCTARSTVPCRGGSY